ncbi:MAG: carboxypeptidase regulatory-like domain-containing protein [Thermoanaerobaculia bacterium]
MRKTAGRYVLGTLVALGLFASPGTAQLQSGNLFATVTDSAGAALPGATVTLSGIGAPQTQSSDAQGMVRFPGLAPGTYRLEAGLDGFSPLVFESVVVNVGRNTTLELALSSAVEETITITAESPLLDSRKVATGATIDQIELERIPTARDPWVVLQSTPGVQNDRVNVGGNESGQQSDFVANGDDGDNSTFAIDGVEITDIGAIGSSSSYFDFDAFEEMQVSTGGSDATLRTGGASLNLVTKRGTNVWRGSARYLKADGSWQSDTGFEQSDLGPGQPSFKSGNRIVNVEDQGIEVGGAILRDRLWVWGSYGEQNIKLLTRADTPDNTTLETWNGKINWQVAKNNSFTFFASSNDKVKIGRNASPTRPPETTFDQSGYSGPNNFVLFKELFGERPTVLKLEDSHIFGSNLYATVLYSEVGGGFGFEPQGGTSRTQAGPLRDRDRVWHNSYYQYLSDRPQDQYKADISYYVDSANVNHELRFGANQREGKVDSFLRWPGMGYAVQSGPDPTRYTVALTGDLHPSVEVRYRNAYLQDTLTFGNWTLNAGVRYDEQGGEHLASCSEANPAFPDLVPRLCFKGGDIGYSWTTLSPRLGATLAVGEEKKTLVRASYARFAEQLGAADAGKTNPLYYYPAFYARAYDTNGNLAIEPGEVTEFLFPNATLSGADENGNLGQSIDFLADPGLNAPTTDELVFAVEHALLPEFVVGASVTYRLERDLIESELLVFDGDAFADENLAQSGRRHRRDDYVVYENVDVTFPDGQTSSVPVYGLRPGVTTRGGIFTVNTDKERVYKGLTLFANKRLSNRWSARANVTLSDWRWKVPDSAIDDPNQTGIDDYGDYAVGGNRDGDRVVQCSGGSGAKQDTCQSARWTYSANVFYQIAPERPWGFNVAASAYGREGYAIPYSFLGARPDLPSGEQDYLASSRPDARRNDDVHVLDLRLEKELQFGDLALTLGGDIFNALNNGVVLQRRAHLDGGAGGFVDEVLSPRIFRLGARISFR